MLAKLTSKNRLTLPKTVISDFPDTRYFDVTQEDGRIVLTPVRMVGPTPCAGRWSRWVCRKPTWRRP